MKLIFLFIIYVIIEGFKILLSKLLLEFLNLNLNIINCRYPILNNIVKVIIFFNTISVFTIFFHNYHTLRIIYYRWSYLF